MISFEMQSRQKGEVVRADNGKGEFGPVFQDHLKTMGIIFEPYPPYKHSLNSVSERGIYTIDCKIRSLLFDADLPPEFWDYTIEHTVYIKNRVSIAALPFRNITAITPYEALYGVEVNLKSIKAFSYSA